MFHFFDLLNYLRTLWSDSTTYFNPQNPITSSSGKLLCLAKVINHCSTNGVYKSWGGRNLGKVHAVSLIIINANTRKQLKIRTSEQAALCTVDSRYQIAIEIRGSGWRAKIKNEETQKEIGSIIAHATLYMKTFGWLYCTEGTQETKRI